MLFSFFYLDTFYFYFFYLDTIQYPSYNNIFLAQLDSEKS